MEAEGQGKMRLPPIITADRIGRDRAGHRAALPVDRFQRRNTAIAFKDAVLRSRSRRRSRLKVASFSPWMSTKIALAK